MPKLINITGMRFGRLIVIARAGLSNGNHILWLCQCDCGSQTMIIGSDIRRGHTQSCGCLWIETIKISNSTHGYTRQKKSREYRIWTGMISRCYNPNVKSFKYYGGRGIIICDRWRGSFETFFADMGPRPAGKSIDRWPDPDGNYEPDNCRWATAKEQRANQSKAHQRPPPLRPPA